MEVQLATINQFLADMLLPFMRISGLFVAMIGLSAKSIPPQVRALLGIMLTLIIMPVVPPSPIENLVDVGTFLIVIQQLLTHPVPCKVFSTATVSGTPSKGPTQRFHAEAIWSEGRIG